jgi:hypothetical protein
LFFEIRVDLPGRAGVVGPLDVVRVEYVYDIGIIRIGEEPHCGARAIPGNDFRPTRHAGSPLPKLAAAVAADVKRRGRMTAGRLQQLQCRIGQVRALLKNAGGRIARGGQPIALIADLADLTSANDTRAGPALTAAW